ncbi:MAG: hypothetical protein ACRC3Z_05120 [Phocaeicola sp.]
MALSFKQSKVWMMFSNVIHVWFGKGKLKYWQFILDRVLNNYETLSIQPKSSKDIDKMIIVMIDGFPGGQGGLTDRLRGALSVYSLCKECNYVFKFYFNYPFDLKQYLIPNQYSWTIESCDILRNRSQSKPIALYLMNVPFENWLDHYLLKREIEQTDYEQYHIYTSAFFDKMNYPTLFNELFKPSALLQYEIDWNKKMIGGKYISATFRFQELLGDLKEAPECKTLSEFEQKKLIIQCLQALKSFIDNTHLEYKILVTSDSTRFLNEAKKLNRVYIIPGKIFHPHFEVEGDKPFLKSFIDFYLLMEAQEVHLLRTGLMYKSGFPEFAALLGGKKFYSTKF